MGVVVTLKSKMAASSASSGDNSTGSVLFDLSDSNKLPEPLLDGPATSEHMLALLPFKIPASGKYDAILDSFVTTTPTMHVRAAKSLFDVTMHKSIVVGIEKYLMCENKNVMTDITTGNFAFILIFKFFLVIGLNAHIHLKNTHHNPIQINVTYNYLNS